MTNVKEFIIERAVEYRTANVSPRADLRNINS